MKTPVKICLYISFVVIAVLAVVTQLLPSNNAQKMPQYDVQTVQALNDCEAISSKSVMDLPEFLEFQKIEKQGRKSRVMQMCMDDRGYKINPAWLSAMQTQAKDIASKETISIDAALEELKRKTMYLASNPSTPVLLWIKQ